MLSTTVKLNVTHSKHKIQALELRFDTQSSIASVKESLQRRFGTSPDYMTLQLKDETDTVIALMNNDEEKLEYYQPADFYTIHIVDFDPESFGFDDFEEVPKYEISDEDYQARDDTFRKFMEEKRKQDPNFGRSTRPQTDPEFQAEIAAGIQVGARCRVNPGDKRGYVRYVGKVEQAAPGWFLGIELDEPLGKNDGSVKGVRYFDCAPNFGLFIRPDAVELGDFAPADEEPDEI